MDENMIFSVVIPVYNVEPYLKECVNSVLKQSCSDYEIILVDDESTDGSGQLCDIMAVEKKRVKVIHKKNGGTSDARNKGLEIAKGEYVIFLDADDYWDDDDFLKKMKEIINREVPDLIVCGYRKSHEWGVETAYVPARQCDNLTDLVVADELNICPWDKVTKRMLLINHKITFRKGVTAEEMEWCAQLYLYAEKCAVLQEAPYIYRQRQGSITRNITEKNIDDIISNYEKCMYIQSQMDYKKRIVFNHYLAKNLSMLMITLSKVDEIKRKRYYPFVEENLPVLKYGLRKREKIIYLVAKINGVSMTVRLLRMYDNYLGRKAHYGKNN